MCEAYLGNFGFSNKRRGPDNPICQRGLLTRKYHRGFEDMSPCWKTLRRSGTVDPDEAMVDRSESPRGGLTKQRSFPISVSHRRRRPLSNFAQKQYTGLLKSSYTVIQILREQKPQRRYTSVPEHQIYISVVWGKGSPPYDNAPSSPEVRAIYPHSIHQLTRD